MSRHHALIKNDPRYLAARLEVLERDGHTCADVEQGGCSPDLQADHIVELHVLFDRYDQAEAIEWAVDPTNLVTRCGHHNRARYAEGPKDTEVTRLEYVNPNYPEVTSVIGVSA